MNGFSFDYKKLDWEKFTKETEGMNMVEFLKYCRIVTPDGLKEIEVTDRDKKFFEIVKKKRRVGDSWAHRLKYRGSE